jgi:elongation factor G
MTMTDVQKIRNVVVIAHGSAGKTSLTEAMLFDSGAINRLGTVEAGNTVTDFEPEEVEKQITISSSLAHCTWNDLWINLIDTPGFVNLLEDTKGSMKAADGAIVLASALSGVKGETERLWRYADDFGMPRVVFVNKMDREAADFYAALESIDKAFGLEAVPLQLPIGSGEDFKGIVDLFKMKAFEYNDGKPSGVDIPSDLQDNVEQYRKKLIEKVAESDDTLLEKYLETELH